MSHQSDKSEYLHLLMILKIPYYIILKIFCSFLGTYFNAKTTIIVRDNNNKISGVLPLLSTKGKYGIAINSLPFFGSNGSILASSDIAKNELIGQFNHLIHSCNAATTTIVENPFNTDSGNYFLANEQTNIHTDHRISQFTLLPHLLKSEKELFKIFRW